MRGSILDGSCYRLRAIVAALLLLSGCGPSPSPESVPPVPDVSGPRMVIQSLQSAPTQGTDCTLPAPSELVEIFNVPRGKKERITAFIKFVGGPFGADATLTIKSEESNIMTTVDPETDQAGAVLLKVKKGDDRSSSFIIEGITIDKTRLDVGRVIDIKNPDDPEDDVTYPGNFVDVVVWDFEEDQIVDYNALGDYNPNAMSDTDNRCYQGDQSSPALKADMAKRVDCGTKAEAVAADGASLQLLRVKAGGFGKFCFTFPGGDPPAGTRAEYYGKFSDPIAGGSSTASPATNVDAIAYQSPDEPGVQYWGLGTYTPPTDFFETGRSEREVEVEVQFMAFQGPGIPTQSHITAVRGKKIKIRRPPAILVHGLWSSSKTWSEAFRKPTPRGARLVEKKFSYDGNLPYTQLLARNVTDERLDLRIRDLVSNTRLGINPDPEPGVTLVKIATTKVDVIAHSMGGLYTRQWLQNGTYKKSDNFNRGDINKLATLTSPHWGARLANALINLHENFYDAANNLHDEKLSTAEGLGEVHEGAICELAENSFALNSADAMDVMVKAYVASGGHQDEWHYGIDWALRKFTDAERAMHSDPYIYHAPNDGIVSVVSQLDSLPVGYNFTSLLHTVLGLGSFMSPSTYTVTENADVARRIYMDLDTPTGWVAVMPGYSIGLSGATLNGGRGQDVDHNNYLSQCGESGAGGPMYRFGQAQ